MISVIFLPKKEGKSAEKVNDELSWVGRKDGRKLRSDGCYYMWIWHFVFWPGKVKRKWGNLEKWGLWWPWSQGQIIVTNVAICTAMLAMLCWLAVQLTPNFFPFYNSPRFSDHHCEKNIVWAIFVDFLWICEVCKVSPFCSHDCNLRSGVLSFSRQEGTPDTITWLFVCC